jgi:holo-[acyl-carrier protein] synthase
MPLRPFPFPLRVGTDICSIARIRKLLTPKAAASSPPLVRFLPKLLTWPERRYFWERFASVENAQKELDAVSHFLAGRYEHLSCSITRRKLMVH